MVVAEIDDLGDVATAAVRELLEQFRREVLASIVGTQEPFVATYRQLLAEIDAYLTSLHAGMVRALGEQLERAAEAGDADALDELRGSSLDLRSYVGVSPELVRASAEYVADLVTGVTDETRARLTREVRLAALGGRTTTDLIERIGRTLNDRGVFRTLAERAEAIARTETARIRNTAHYQQSVELAGRYPGMRKQWVHAVSAPGATGHQRRMSRPNHVALAARTAGEPIPVDESFSLGGGITARFPHDPLLPASESVNCRCRVAVIAPEPVGTQQRGQPAGSAIGPSLDVTVKGKLGKAVNDAISAIESVHGDGPLYQIPVKPSSAKSWHGLFRYRQSMSKSRAVDINISRAGDYPHLTMAHEFGHYLDFAGFGDVAAGLQGEMMSRRPDLLPERLRGLASAWADAVRESKALKMLEDMRQGPSRITIQGTSGNYDFPIDKAYLRYMTSAHEVWARSYAQYIAIRSGNAAMLRELDVTRTRERSAMVSYSGQWEDDDFAPIAAAFDALFREMGWIA
ncbi:MAG: hypothetical protein NAOJABEB_02967 [Steroidobacteraceae bacterium]|nr:hypothetical protein [Steroidobacteraceae bacterium]